MVKLRVVGASFSLLWPQALGFGRLKQYRGPAGYVVDLDGPCETEFLKGQEHKLISVADARDVGLIEAKKPQANFVDEPVALRIMVEAGHAIDRNAVRKRTRADKIAENDAEGSVDGDGDDGDIDLSEIRTSRVSSRRGTGLATRRVRPDGEAVNVSQRNNERIAAHARKGTGRISVSGFDEKGNPIHEQAAAQDAPPPPPDGDPAAADEDPDAAVDGDGDTVEGSEVDALDFEQDNSGGN